MTFPDSPRVIYKTNPLREVVCQIRFPSILRVTAEPPAAFQERVRKGYPLFARKTELPPGLPPEIAAQLPAVVSAPNYEFKSADDGWRVNLTQDFLALTTTSYDRWETFRDRFKVVFDALSMVYEPPFFSRVGLRYVDVISKSMISPPPKDWAALLAPPILGELAPSALSSDIKHVAKEVVVGLSDGPGNLRMRHGLAKIDNEERYAIDCDFFLDDRCSVPDCFQHLDRYNRLAGRLFRWCITDELHRALGPSAP